MTPRRLIVTMGVLMTVTTVARADQVWIGKLAYANARITDVKECRVYFALSSNRKVKKISELTRVEITADPKFTGAEKLMAVSKKYSAAADIYSEMLRKGSVPANRPWMLRLVAHRLRVAAEKAGRIDMAVQAWLTIMDANHAGPAANDVLALRPKVPAKTAEGIDAAINLLAARENHKSATYRDAVNPYRMKLLQLTGRDEEAANLAERIIKRKPPTSPPGQPPTNRARVLARIDAGEQLLKVNRSGEAVALLEPMVMEFTEAELPRALTLLGRGQMSLGKSASGDKRKTLLCKATLSFMRVVVCRGSSPNQKAQALVLAGQVNELFSKPNKNAAKACYQKVLTTEVLKSTPAAAQAKALLSRLK